MLQVSSNAQLTFHLRYTAKIIGSNTSSYCGASSLQKGEPRQAAACYDPVGQGWPDVEFISELLAGRLTAHTQHPGARAADPVTVTSHNHVCPSYVAAGVAKVPVRFVDISVLER